MHARLFLFACLVFCFIAWLIYTACCVVRSLLIICAHIVTSSLTVLTSWRHYCDVMPAGPQPVYQDSPVGYGYHDGYHEDDGYRGDQGYREDGYHENAADLTTGEESAATILQSVKQQVTSTWPQLDLTIVCKTTPRHNTRLQSVKQQVTSTWPQHDLTIVCKTTPRHHTRLQSVKQQVTSTWP